MGLTATQFIRLAALKTPRVEVAMGKVVEYQDAEMESVEDTRCWLCGGDTNGQGMSTKKAIKPTFTNHDAARAPVSKSVCMGCAFCLSPRELRNYSILATEQGLKHPTRPEIRDILLGPPEPPFVLCLAVSGQKHLHFRAAIAYSRDDFSVQLEEVRTYVDRNFLPELLEWIEQLYTVFTKEEIKIGQYSQNRIKQLGINKFLELEKRAGLHRGRRLFDLAVFVAQKREVDLEVDAPAAEQEKEEQCITILTPEIENKQLHLF